MMNWRLLSCLICVSPGAMVVVERVGEINFHTLSLFNGRLCFDSKKSS